MNNLNQMYEEASNDAKHTKIVNEAKDTYAKKPYVVEYYSLFLTSKICKFVLPLFSVATGFGFLYYQFVSNLHFIPATIFALILLILLELVKADISTKTFKRVLAGHRPYSTNLLLSLISFALFALSVFLSVNGAEELYKQLDKSEIDYKQAMRTKLDSISKIYDARIKSNQEALNGFKKQISWQDKIDMTNQSIAEVIKSHQEQATRLEVNKEKEKTSLLSHSEKELKNLESKNGFNIWFWFSLSLVIEFLIMISLWFDMNYKYNVAKEDYTFNSQEKFSLSKDELWQAFRNMTSTQTNTPQLSNEIRQIVGFQSNKQVENKKSNLQGNLGEYQAGNQDSREVRMSKFRDFLNSQPKSFKVDTSEYAKIYRLKLQDVFKIKREVQGTQMRVVK